MFGFLLKNAMGVCLVSCLLSLVTSCGGTTSSTPTDQPMSEKTEELAVKTNRPFNTPEWAATANIYELNVRQYTPEGTFAAMRKHLPRLAEMGVDVVWFMPICPISELKRKGSMGSYYSSADFQSVNPEFGTLAEFKSIVDEIHALGMHVILDWTANHTGWDHPWVKEHPEYYIKRAGTDTIRHAFNPNDGGETDWYDIAQLNYGNPDLAPVMIEQMRFWRKQTGIDGFRCDVAGFVPIDFWYQARPELEKDGPLYMLAEWGDEPLHFEAAFDVNYGWSFHQLLNKVAEGEAGVEELWQWQENDLEQYPPYAIHLNFTTNHDENSWNGTEYERMGALADAFWIVCATFNGTPLIYSGQEEPLKRRLAFFEKDDIAFSAFAKTSFFKTMLSLKRVHPALRNGSAGAVAKRLMTSTEHPDLFAYSRSSDEHHVVVLVNLGDKSDLVPVADVEKFGQLRNLYSDAVVDQTKDKSIVVPAKGFVVLTSDQ